MHVGWRAVVVVLLAGGCQCLVPVSEDGGVGFDAGGAPDASVPTDGGVVPDGGADAGVADAGVSVDDAGADAGALDAGVDAGAVDGGAVDAGAVDAGAVDAGVDGGGSDAGTLLTCASVRCTAWSTCIEDGGATCVPTVTALRWVLPVADAAVPIDTIRLAVAVEVTGSAESIPVSASGAGQSNTVASRTDGGLAVGGLSFVTLDAGLLVLTAGWSGGPEASTTVRVVPSRAVEVVGSNPPSHGVNTADFEPNDPEGDAWRRDDVVPFRAWPGVQVIAQHLHPDASAALIDAGEGCDGGCASFRLQDVEFNAFRGEVELRVSSDAGWEARGERLTVTRWRWRRVVAGVPNPQRIQMATLLDGAIVVGTLDTAISGRLRAFDGDGYPVSSSWFPSSWTAAVTAPPACSLAVAGHDGDGGFVWREGTAQHRTPGRYALLTGVDAYVLAVTNGAEVHALPVPPSGPFRAPGVCAFDAGVAALGAYRYFSVLSSVAGEACLTHPEEPDAGTWVLPLRISPNALFHNGLVCSLVTTSGELVEVDRFGAVRFVANVGPADTLVGSGSGLSRYLSTPGGELLRIQGATTDRVALGSRALETPVVRGGGAREDVYLVDESGRLNAVAWSSARGLATPWSWRPDGGLSPATPPSFFFSPRRLGTVVVGFRDGVVGLVAEGHSSGLQSGGDPANCGGEMSFTALP